MSIPPQDGYSYQFHYWGDITFLAAAPENLTYIYYTRLVSMDVTIDGTTPISWDIQGLPEVLSYDKTTTAAA